ncbi:hypothetical protein ACFQ0O_41920 [Saccharopolyspora spinosporotrichia]
MASPSRAGTERQAKTGSPSRWPWQNSHVPSHSVVLTIGHCRAPRAPEYRGQRQRDQQHHQSRDQ